MTTDGFSGRHVFERATARPVAVRAHGCTIVTADGTEYLDASGGAIASSIGHGHPHVVRAMAAQAAAVDYVHATQFTTAALHDYADRLAEIVPVDDLRVFPVSGGSEANETALKLARSYHLARGEDRHVIVARGGAYHGNTRGVLDASDRAGLRAGYEPWIGQTLRVPAANRYRDDRTGAELAAQTERIMIEAGVEQIAAFIGEPISGATLGVAHPPDCYWPAIAEICQRHGVLLILDEVMTGFGRTGAWFAADHDGLRPDIITAGKGASSGYWPLGLCLVAGHVADAVQLAGNFAHGFTWSHHPIGAAAAGAVLDVLVDEDLVVSARPKGERLRAAIRASLDGHPNVGDIRGTGLMTAVEFVVDHESRAPFDRSEVVAEQVTAACFARRMTVYPCTSAVDGAIGDAVVLGPPLTVSDAEIDEIASRLAGAIRDVLPV